VNAQSGAVFALDIKSPALQTRNPPKEDAEGWPGAEFGMDTGASKALLGSPVGIWAVYFLMQHKRQLGGNKFISKVRVFKSEKAGSLTYILFYVKGPASRTGFALDNRDIDNEGTNLISERRVTRSAVGAILCEGMFSERSCKSNILSTTDRGTNGKIITRTKNQGSRNMNTQKAKS
jgi:hypothetical protein